MVAYLLLLFAAPVVVVAVCFVYGNMSRGRW